MQCINKWVKIGNNVDNYKVKFNKTIMHATASSSWLRTIKVKIEITSQAYGYQTGATRGWRWRENITEKGV